VEGVGKTVNINRRSLSPLHCIYAERSGITHSGRVEGHERDNTAESKDGLGLKECPPSTVYTLRELVSVGGAGPKRRVALENPAPEKASRASEVNMKPEIKVGAAPKLRGNPKPHPEGSAAPRSPRGKPQTRPSGKEPFGWLISIQPSRTLCS
jgi:hypothetical protein